MPPERAALVDLFERALSRGIVVEIEPSRAAAPETQGEASAWLQVSIAGVEVVKVDAGVSWRPLIEDEEGE